jgi:hypothetical protein
MLGYAVQKYTLHPGIGIKGDSRTALTLEPDGDAGKRAKGGQESLDILDPNRPGKCGSPGKDSLDIIRVHQGVDCIAQILLVFLALKPSSGKNE